MKAVVTIFLSGLFASLNPQETITSQKSNSSEIKGRMLYSIYQQELVQSEEIINILNLDVLGYYDLKNQYNTDLKRTTYKESEDYKTKHLELEKLRSQMISSTYFLDFEPDYYDEKSIAINYNADTRSFSVSNNISLSSFYNENGFIQFDRILFKCPSGMAVTRKNINYACVDVVEETISFEIKNQNMVPEIEENKNFLRLLFVFSFTGTVALKADTFSLISSDYCFMTDLKSVVVYNSRTNEVYSSYK